jgi:lipoprotein-releasing system permease protein
MILTLAFVNGFQQTVSQKIFSFWGHVRVQQFGAAKAIVAEETPLLRNDTVERLIRANPEVTAVQAFATKSVVVEYKREIEGLLCKGVENTAAFAPLQPFLTAGHWISFGEPLYSHEIVLSQKVADKLNIHVNDSISIFFIQGSQKRSNRNKLRVSGLFKTGIEQYDNYFALCDIRLLRRVNDWNSNVIGGYEVFLKDYNRMDTVSKDLTGQLPGKWISRTIREIQPDIFDWLNIQDVNRNVIFITMAAVAIINLITCLLILVLERTTMVGILKAIGARDIVIQRIFLYHSAIIAGRGILIGLVCGIGICLLQQRFGFIRLDESNYYVTTAPVALLWWQVAAVCIATLLVCLVALLIPTYLVKTVRPVKAIQFR